MSQKKTTLEVIASSIEEAVADGLVELGLTENDVEVEVLDIGSRGLFGLGSRQARVRLVVKDASAGEISEDEVRSEIELAGEISLVDEEEFLDEESGYAALKIDSEEDVDPEQEQLLQSAIEIVSELLDKMGIRAKVSAHIAEAEDDRSKSPVWVDVRGNDLSILIGPRAETLQSLQYIASMILNKEIGHSVTLVVDVEGYRVRRIQQLRQLARRMADQAIRSGRKQVLEPMPAGDRRIVHIELRGNPKVTTESIGEDPKRKVTIVPK